MHDLVIRAGVVVDGTGAAPRTADVAIDGDRIAKVGRVSARGRSEIEADGALVAPGWADVHTHYDGQATWDAELAPSSRHGVTTAIMGNCGVGFAPVRPGSEGFLIELMEGVEDIPGTALHEGMPWGWETFGQYLDALAVMPRTMDIGTTVPHAAVRAYVLGERAHEDDLTLEECAEIGTEMAEGIREGAFGCSTSRTILHRSKHGYVPGTWAGDAELGAIADAVAELGYGLFQFVSDGAVTTAELSWLAYLAQKGVDTTYTLTQLPHAPEVYRSALEDAATQQAAGVAVTPQVPVRPTGMLYGLQSSFHPFMAHPSYRRLWGLPLDELHRAFTDPFMRAKLLAEESHTKQKATVSLATAWHQMYELGDPPDYEPPRETSAKAVAQREGRTPQEVVYDWMSKADGTSLMFSPLGSYVDHNHDALREMMTHPVSIFGASDGGAHCGLICDASFPTYLLTHWTRDRSRGERIPVEQVVHKQTQATAQTYGMADRGVLAETMLADINVIDRDALHLHAPHMVHDLPAGGKRLLQQVDGYLHTIKAGQVTFVDGEPTGALPGRTLKRHPTGIARI